MPEAITAAFAQYLGATLLSLGGAAGVTLIILRIFKQTLQKWIETAIECSSEKVLATLTNDLQRRTSAYDKLLEKEFEYYDTIAPTLSDILTTAGSMPFDPTDSPSLQDMHRRTNAARADAVRSAMNSFESALYLYRCYYPDALFAEGQSLLQACRPFLGVSPARGDLEALQAACSALMSHVKRRLSWLSESQSAHPDKGGVMSL